MCCLCDAYKVLEAREPVLFTWAGSDLKLEFEGKGKRPELAKAKYRFRRAGDAEWNGWYDTVDLAGVMSRLNTDAFSIERVQSVVTAWLNGGALQPVLDAIAEHETLMRRVLENRDDCDDEKTSQPY